MIGRAWPVILLLPAVAGAADQPLKIEDLKIPLWNWDLQLSGGAGYKDNVTFSHTNGHGGGFWSSGAEIMVFRLPARGWFLNAFLDFSDVRYFDVPAVNSEQSAVAGIQLTKTIRDGWKSKLGVTGLYQNQVLDVSDVYTNQNSIGQIIGWTLTPRWGLRKAMAQFWVEGEFSGTRQWFESPLDSYWQYGPRLAAGCNWGRGSELQVSCQFSRLDYDRRLQVNLSGTAVTNASLALNMPGVELSLVQVWDQKRHWQTDTTVGFEAVFDNGSGYFDYNGWRVGQRIRYRDDQWEISAQARVNYLDFLSQTVGVTDKAARHRLNVNLALRAERKLAKHLKIYASYAWNGSFSNLDFDDYRANTVMAGITLMFR